MGVYGPETTESNRCLQRRPSLKATVAFTVGLIYYTRGVTIHESKGVKSVQ